MYFYLRFKASSESQIAFAIQSVWKNQVLSLGFFLFAVNFKANNVSWAAEKAVFNFVGYAIIHLCFEKERVKKTRQNSMSTNPQLPQTFWNSYFLSFYLFVNKQWYNTISLIIPRIIFQSFYLTISHNQKSQCV